MHIVVFEKFTSAHLFQIAQAKSCDYLIIYTKNITKTTTKLTARAFLAHSTDWLKQITNIVKFKHFQDNAFKLIHLRTWKCVRIDFTPAC